MWGSQGHLVAHLHSAAWPQSGTRTAPRTRPAAALAAIGAPAPLVPTSTTNAVHVATLHPAAM
eukprot:1892018-Amphidinium_carterae.1